MKNLHSLNFELVGYTLLSCKLIKLPFKVALKSQKIVNTHTILSLLLSSLSSSESCSAGDAAVTNDDGQVHSFFGRISTATMSSCTARLRFTSP